MQGRAINSYCFISMTNLSDLMLFGLNASYEFATQVSSHMGLQLAPHEEREFEDGEHKARPLVSVRGKDVYVLHSLYGDPVQTANDKLMRLLLFIGALKDGAAARVTAVVPYLAYARKDRKTKIRDPVSTRYVAALFEAVGTDVVMTLDVHNLAAFQNSFRCRTEHFLAAPLLIEKILPEIGKREIVVVSPDAGGIKRAEEFRQRLSTKIKRPVGAAFVEKYRSEGVVSGNLFAGIVNDCDVIIVDDLISSGTTVMRAVNACRDRHAVHIIVAASHGLFSADAITVLNDPALQHIVISDSVSPWRIEKSNIYEKIVFASCSSLFAQAIMRSHTNESMSELAEI